MKGKSPWAARAQPDLAGRKEELSCREGVPIQVGQHEKEEPRGNGESPARPGSAKGRAHGAARKSSTRPGSTKRKCPAGAARKSPARPGRAI